LTHTVIVVQHPNAFSAPAFFSTLYFSKKEVAMFHQLALSTIALLGWAGSVGATVLTPTKSPPPPLRPIFIQNSGYRARCGRRAASDQT
jgi:hypothetical protein